MQLKSTKQTVYELPWKATAVRPWDINYTRILIPFNGKRKKAHIQIVRKDSLIEA